jgi:hypothetical protein
MICHPSVLAGGSGGFSFFFMFLFPEKSEQRQNGYSSAAQSTPF